MFDPSHVIKNTRKKNMNPKVELHDKIDICIINQDISISVAENQ